MEMMQCLEESYGYNEPILLNEVNIHGMTEKYLRQTFSRLVKRGKLERFDQGVYYIPKVTPLGRSRISAKKVYEKKYITDKDSIYGFYSGLIFEKAIGINSQEPDVIEIVTNNESSRIREVIIGSQKIRIRKPIVEITNQNVEILQILDLMNHINLKEMSENSKHRLLKYVRGRKLKKEELFSYITKFPARTAMNLIESRAINELL